MNGLCIDGHWIGIHDGDGRAAALHRRHYSKRHYKDGRSPKKFVGPSEQIVLMTVDCLALFVWVNSRPEYRLDKQEGIRCAVFRNEGPILSSELILEAEPFAWTKWGEQRLYTYVNDSMVNSPNPGYCFKMAGWDNSRNPDGSIQRNKDGRLTILEKLPT